MTSLGNVLQLFDLASTPDGDQLDPGTLNAWLGRDAELTEGGWISKGYFYGNVVWTDVATYTARLNAENPEAVRLRFRGRGSGSPEEIHAELSAGRPVILAVPGHFIAAVGLDGDDVILHDPYFPERTRLSEYPSAVLSSRLFEPADDLSALLITAPSGVRIRVRDPQGRLLGTLSLDTPEAVQFQANTDIPGSSFAFEAAWRDPTCTERAPDPGAGNFTLHIPTPLPGRYDVEVVDPDGTGTCVAIYEYDRDGNVTLETVCGPGDKQFSFDYGPPEEVTEAFLRMEGDGSSEAAVVSGTNISSIHFGDVAIGRVSEQSVAITNARAGALEIERVELVAIDDTSRAFSIQSCAAPTLLYADRSPRECQLMLSFAPYLTDLHQVELHVYHTGVNASPHILRVRGFGVGIPPSPTTPTRRSRCAKSSSTTRAARRRPPTSPCWWTARRWRTVSRRAPAPAPTS